MSDTKQTFNIQGWMRDHRDFVAWWKEHRHSGFVEDSDGRAHYGIPPWQAWGVDRYRAEYTGRSRYYSAAEIREMRALQGCANTTAPEFIAENRQEAQAILQLCVQYMAGKRAILVDGKAKDAESAEEYVFHKIREPRGLPINYEQFEIQNTRRLSPLQGAGREQPVSSAP